MDCSKEKYIRPGKNDDGKDVYWVEINKRRPDGTKFRKVSKFRDLEKAIRVRDEWLTLCDSNGSDEIWTLDKWATECFENHMPFPHGNRKGLKPNTIHGYRLLYNQWIGGDSGPLGGVTLSNLKPEQIAEVLNRKMGPERDGDTKANVRNVVSKLYSLAQLYNKVPTGFNPAKVVGATRSEKKYDESGHEIEHVRNLTNDEQTTFLNKAYDAGSWAYLGFLIGLRMGMRVGEILGFDLRLVDWDKCLYTVRDQVNRRKPAWGDISKGGKRKPGSVGPMGSLKKDGSYRVVPIPPSIMGELRKIRADQPFTTYVFLHPSEGDYRKGAGACDGRHRTPDDFSGEFRTYAEAAGLFGCKDSTGRPLKDPTPQDMRHTFAFYHATALKTPETVLMKILGHKDPSTTKKYYQVAGNDDVIAAMSRMA